MLTRKADAQMEFDLDKVVEQSRDNPVFYVQYAHARCRSVLRAAGDPAVADLASAPLDALADPAELALIRRMAAWPRTVEAAAEAREPHRVAFFLHDLADDFHVLWNKGREDATLRFLQGDEPEATRAQAGSGRSHGGGDPLRTGGDGGSAGRGDAVSEIVVPSWRPSQEKPAVSVRMLAVAGGLLGVVALGAAVAWGSRASARARCR